MTPILWHVDSLICFLIMLIKDHLKAHDELKQPKKMFSSHDTKANKNPLYDLLIHFTSSTIK